LNLGPFLATGSAVEWEFNGPDSSGYYFITNTAGHALNGSGAAPAISFNTTTSSTQNNNTRWRLVKAYQPVSTSVSVPNNLSFYFTNQGVALSWSVDSNLYYNIYRSTASGGPYALIARVSSSTSYTDTAASSNSVPWYYVITGLNAFGDESGYSTRPPPPSPLSGVNNGLAPQSTPVTPPILPTRLKMASSIFLNGRLI